MKQASINVAYFVGLFSATKTGLIHLGTYFGRSLGIYSLTQFSQRYSLTLHSDKGYEYWSKISLR